MLRIEALMHVHTLAEAGLAAEDLPAARKALEGIIRTTDQDIGTALESHDIRRDMRIRMLERDLADAQSERNALIDLLHRTTRRAHEFLDQYPGSGTSDLSVIDRISRVCPPPSVRETTLPPLHSVG